MNSSTPHKPVVSTCVTPSITKTNVANDDHEDDHGTATTIPSPLGKMNRDNERESEPTTFPCRNIIAVNEESQMEESPQKNLVDDDDDDDEVRLNEKLEQKLKRAQWQLSIRDKFDKEQDEIQKKEFERLKKERDEAQGRNLTLEQELEETRAQLTTSNSNQRTLRKELKFLRNEYEKIDKENEILEGHVREIWNRFAAYRDKCERQQEKQKERLALLLESYDFEETKEAEEENRILGPVRFDLVETGERIGDYRVGSHLGHGKFAHVRKGIHRGTNEQYAIKGIKKKDLSMRELEREVSILTLINHPNVIKAVEVYHTPNVVYVVMELGCMDLHDYKAKIEMTENDVCEVMIGILRPVEYLHSLGICHSDIKRENILIMNMDNSQPRLHRSNIRLCDFGLCSFSDAANADANLPVYQDMFKGTIPIAAPEVVTCATTGRYDARPADMWTLGVALMELTFGLPDGWEETYKLHETNTVGFQQGIEGCLNRLYKQRFVCDDIVHSLLIMKPESRQTATQVLAHEWFKD